ncbi:rRNA-processing protein efg1 [Penicillium malachiteum]|uniref:rRNA-processing protein efg1 n=1 Tax=Penicillium malachiteum TaxID=1324776 RepID=UPI0025498938|nr:rRNA-processing protein efg1 [Penicillium malachiteum]KAJ5735416.1 rRNA-processing protein efg1 [Penicillium malachiteum]
MPDSHHSRGDSSKRKSRHDSGDLAPRKKQHRSTRDHDQDIQMEDSGSDGDQRQSHSTQSKGKPAPRNEREAASVNDLKRRIRDVKRLLNKAKLPADARVVQERALAGYEQDLADETARRDRSQMIKKYHFVRFLDRKTANKNLNSLLRREKEEGLDSKQKSRLQQKIHDARVNVNYTIYYPLTEKYLSLYPKQEKASAEAGAESGSEADTKKPKQQETATRPPLWSVVEKCTAEGTLDRLREGKLNIGHDGQPISEAQKPAQPVQPKKDSKKPKKEESQEEKPTTRRERRATKDVPNGKRDKQNRKDYGKERDRLQDVAIEAAGDDSDGGFFEE